MEENECRDVRGEENVGSSNGGRVDGRGVLERVVKFLLLDEMEMKPKRIVNKTGSGFSKFFDFLRIDDESNFTLF